MNTRVFQFHGVELNAHSSGALWWPGRRCLVVSDLHLGKSERIARRSGMMLPPYETRDTLIRLSDAMDALDPATIICLGDSFDDLAAAEALAEPDRQTLNRLQAGRHWIWVEGNHDPGSADLGGSFRDEVAWDGLVFRHIAQSGATAEISGHYHPKVRLPTGGRTVSRRCFLLNDERLILPAFGTYTGGLRTSSAVLSKLMGPAAEAILVCPTLHRIPMPHH